MGINRPFLAPRLHNYYYMSNPYRIFHADNISDYLSPKTKFVSRIDQLSGGKFMAKTEALYCDEIGLFRRTTNQTIREVGQMPKTINSLSFHSTENSFYLKGSYYGKGGISSTMGGHGFESITQKNSSHYTVTISDEALAGYFGNQQVDGFQDFLKVKRDITSCEEKRFAIQNIIDGALNNADRSSVILSAEITSEVMEKISQLVEAASFNQLRVNSNTYLLDRAIHAINGSENPSISILELANKLHTHRRNLELTFKSYLKLSPKEYINALRLNTIRIQLLQATKATMRISTIARANKIQHMGNFSKAYYRLFNERPNETLARPPSTRSEGRAGKSTL